ncbi:MAG: class A beta-lactamase-related serine hydrolase [Deltaproteobacteria bacterium]|nr:MAG: class A beta-lactamase-related serine hydrolase [Deltaproteobacteria bacterium]
MSRRAAIVASVALFAVSACASLPCGAAPGPAPLGRADAPPAPVADTLILLDRWLDNLVAMRHVPGMAAVVLRGPDVLWRREAGFADLDARRPVTPETRFFAGSVTKLVTTVAVLQLRDAGALDLDAKVARYLPDLALAGGDGATITVRELLTHRSGLRREGADPYWMTYSFPDWPTLATELAAAPLDAPPGTRTEYSNVGMAVLGQVVAAVSGQAFADYVAEHVLAPLGMDHSTVRADAAARATVATAYSREKRHLHGARRVREHGDPQALGPAFGLITTADDLARFARFLASAAPDGARVLAATSLAEMRAPQGALPVWTEARGLGFELEKVKGHLRASHNGWFSGHRAELALVPDLGLAVVILANADDAPVREVAHRVLDDLIDAYALASAAAAPATVDEAAALAPLVGLYGAGWLPERDVVLLSDGLWQYTPATATSLPVRQGLARLLPMGGDTFHVGSPDGQVLRFVRGEDGRGQRILLQDGAVWLDRRPEASR